MGTTPRLVDDAPTITLTPGDTARVKAIADLLRDMALAVEISNADAAIRFGDLLSLSTDLRIIAAGRAVGEMALDTETAVATLRAAADAIEQHCDGRGDDAAWLRALADDQAPPAASVTVHADRGLVVLDVGGTTVTLEASRAHELVDALNAAIRETLLPA